MITDRDSAEIDFRSLILPVYIPTLFVMLGNGMIIPVLPLFARSLGAGLGITGVIASICRPVRSSPGRGNCPP
jgi:uncharacterized membrane protein